MTALRVLGLCGSLRRGSYNRALLRVAGGMFPEGMTLEVAEIADLPLYNADREPATAGSWPASVDRLRQQVADADALLFSTPEYNYSVPGVLKNAIDWASRAPDPPLNDKPAGVIGASGGMGGTIRAQLHLRQIGVFTNLHFLNRPEVLIARASERFSPTGELTDEPTRRVLEQFIGAFHAWILRVRRPA